MTPLGIEINIPIFWFWMVNPPIVTVSSAIKPETVPDPYWISMGEPSAALPGAFEVPVVPPWKEDDAEGSNTGIWPWQLRQEVPANHRSEDPVSRITPRFWGLRIPGVHGNEWVARIWYEETYGVPIVTLAK